MFSLYHNKKEIEIRIEKVKDYKKWFLELSCNENEVVRYNDCYYVSNSRKALNDLAKKIKEDWIKEHEELLKKYQNMEILRKY